MITIGKSKTPLYPRSCLWYWYASRKKIVEAHLLDTCTCALALFVQILPDEALRRAHPLFYSNDLEFSFWKAILQSTSPPTAECFKRLSSNSLHVIWNKSQHRLLCTSSLFCPTLSKLFSHQSTATPPTNDPPHPTTTSNSYLNHLEHSSLLWYQEP